MKPSQKIDMTYHGRDDNEWKDHVIDSIVAILDELNERIEKLEALRDRYNSLG